MRRHAAELAAADNADSGVGREREGVMRGVVPLDRIGLSSATRPAVCSLAVSVEPRGKRRVAHGEDRRREQGGVHRARPADREGSDRNAGRHLHDREQAVHALEALAIRPARPSTGSAVQAAHIPGRCAAPPAPR